MGKVEAVCFNTKYSWSHVLIVITLLKERMSILRATGCDQQVQNDPVLRHIPEPNSADSFSLASLQGMVVVKYNMRGLIGRTTGFSSRTPLSKQIVAGNRVFSGM